MSRLRNFVAVALVAAAVVALLALSVNAEQQQDTLAKEKPKVGGFGGRPMAGGFSNLKPVDSDVSAAVTAVRLEIIHKIEETEELQNARSIRIADLSIVGYATQVVAGLNFRVIVAIDVDVDIKLPNWEVTIFRSLPTAGGFEYKLLSVKPVLE